MITEDYVSFETAKLLKEKGFDEKCESLWITDTKESDWIKPKRNSEIKDGCNDCMQPTLSLAMKWLREVHNLGVFPTTYYREIHRNVKHDYGSTIVRLDTYEVIGNDKNIDDYTFEAETYEETADKAIRYCLENLI